MHAKHFIAAYLGKINELGEWYIEQNPTRLSDIAVDKDTVMLLSDDNRDGDIDLMLHTGNNYTTPHGWTFIESHMRNDATNNMAFPLLLSRITNGYGAVTEVTYSSLADRAVYTPMQTFDANGVPLTDHISPQVGMPIVSKVSSSARASAKPVAADMVHINYRYKGLLFDKKGRGQLGFTSLITEDPATGIITQTDYLQEWPFVGRPYLTQSYIENGDTKQIITEATSLWDKAPAANGGSFVYLKSSREKGWQIDSQGNLQFVKHQTIENSYNDGWGNLSSSMVKHFADDTEDKLLLSTETTNTYNGTTVTGAAINPSIADYAQRFGRLNKVVVKQTQAAAEHLPATAKQLFPTAVTAQQAISGSRETLFYYAATTGVLTHEIIAPNCTNAASLANLTSAQCDSSNQLTTSYEYDSFGNKVKVRVQGYLVDRTESTTYSADGRFVIGKTDAAGLTTQISYNGTQAPTGLIYSISTTDANFQTSHQLFNGWGESYSAVSSTGVHQQTRWLSCNSTYCADTDQFFTLVTTTGQPGKIEVIDKLGRVSAVYNQGFHGAWHGSYIAYDLQGNVVEKTEPGYKLSGDLKPSRGREISNYDKFGRLTSSLNSDGSSVKIEYNGLLTTTIDELGFKRTEVNNALGRQVISSDPYMGAQPTNGYVQHFYDNFGNTTLSRVYQTTPSGTPKTVDTTHSYDSYGRKRVSNDPSKGQWLYLNNGLGEIVQQRDGKGATTQNWYDGAGRLVQKSVVFAGRHELSCYSYGASAADNNAGKLVNTSHYVTSNANDRCNTVASGLVYQELPKFDTFGRPSALTITNNGKTFTTSQAYDDLSRPSVQALPQGLLVETRYNAYGYPYQTAEVAGAVLSTVLDMDASGRVTRQQFADNASRHTQFDGRGRISQIDVTDNITGNLYTVSYSYDLKGTTTSRNSRYNTINGNMALSETFAYSAEGHSRLTQRNVTLTNATGLGLTLKQAERFEYDNFGNITQKWNTNHAGVRQSQGSAGSYRYNYAGNPYRLLDVTGGAKVYDFTHSTAYDANGNLQCERRGTSGGCARQFSYNGADMPLSINSGGLISEFIYGADQQRIKRFDRRGSVETHTWYLGKLYEYVEKRTSSTAAWQKEHRWYVGNVVVSLNESSSLKQREVLHSDALGSTVLVRSANDTVSGALDIKLQSMAFYDAFGSQTLLPVQSGASLPQLNAAMQRGYTGHEMLNDLDIIHMNGRIFDPTLARFVQADPTLQFPDYSQGYNRYAYVLNNPFTYTDPSGYFLKWMMKKTGTWNALRAIAKVPLLDVAISMAIAAACGPAAPVCATVSISIFQGAKAYAVTGSLGAGLRAGLISAGTAAVSAKIGNTFKFAKSTSLAIQNIAAHSVVGGVAAVLQGGKFGHGFFSSMVSTSLKSVLTPQQGSYSEAIGRTMISGIVGGTISHLTGGSFSNGAITSALQWWFNAEGGGDWLDAPDNQQHIRDQVSFISELKNSALQRVEVAAEGSASFGTGIKVSTDTNIGLNSRSATIENTKGVGLMASATVGAKLFASEKGVSGLFNSINFSLGAGVAAGFSIAWDYKGNWEVSTKVGFGAGLEVNSAIGYKYTGF